MPTYSMQRGVRRAGMRRIGRIALFGESCVVCCPLGVTTSALYGICACRLRESAVLSALCLRVSVWASKVQRKAGAVYYPAWRESAERRPPELSTCARDRGLLLTRGVCVRLRVH